MRYLQNIGLLGAAVLLFALFAEAFLYAVAGLQGREGGVAPYKHEDLYVSEAPVAVFDPVRGYRRLGRENRVVRIVRDTVVFDQSYRMNNQQFISAIDYQYKRDEERVLRFAVFGDSFTDADYIGTPWPDRLNVRFSEEEMTDGKAIEFYSFSVNGAGLSNWHSILFNDVAPHYDLDGIIIASYGDDFARQFSILHYEDDQSFTGRFETRPDSNDEFESAYKPRLARHYAQVWDNKQIDALVDSHQGELGWASPGLEWRLAKLIKTQLGRMRAEPPSTDADYGSNPTLENVDLFSVEEIEASYGVEQIGQLWEMIAFAKDRDIPLILAAVPSREGLTSWLSRGERRPTSHQIEIKSIGEHFGVADFDGYQAFSGLEPEAIQNRFWLKYDGHWNQAGSDRFADSLGDYLDERFMGNFEQAGQSAN